VQRNEPSLVGIGIYSAAEAARLTRVSANRIRRWLRGNERTHKGERRFDPPLWRPEIVLDDQVYLGFRDLMEVRTAAAFIAEGVSPQTLRRAIEIASRLIEDEHPLSTRRFRTDGRKIFLQVGGEAGDERVLEIFSRQFVFKRIIDPTLRDVEFDLGVPLRWWAAGRGRGIVVDPERSFGQPVDDETGVPTVVLAEAAVAEGSIEAAARAYMVRQSSVLRAVKFEERLAA
jgi:uncharacterized protein (DUF433 family)